MSHCLKCHGWDLFECWDQELTMMATYINMAMVVVSTRELDPGRSSVYSSNLTGSTCHGRGLSCSVILLFAQHELHSLRKFACQFFWWLALTNMFLHHLDPFGSFSSPQPLVVEIEEWCQPNTWTHLTPAGTRRNRGWSTLDPPSFMVLF